MADKINLECSFCEDDIDEVLYCDDCGTEICINCQVDLKSVTLCSDCADMYTNCVDCGGSLLTDDLITCDKCGKEVCSECITDDYPYNSDICDECYDEFLTFMTDNNFPGF